MSKGIGLPTVSYIGRRYGEPLLSDTIGGCMVRWSRSRDRRLRRQRTGVAPNARPCRVSTNSAVDCRMRICLEFVEGMRP